MPLRPVSELGLVDVTELAPPEHRPTVDRRRSRQPKQPPAKPTRGAGAKGSGAPTRTGGGSSDGDDSAARGARPKRQRDGDARKGRSQLRVAEPRDRDKRTRLVPIGIPLVTSAVGVTGGLLLARTALQRRQRILGVPLPGKLELGLTSERIDRASRKADKLAGEMRTVRERTERIGRALRS